MKISILCVSIQCPACGEYHSGGNRRGFAAFMKRHNKKCVVSDFVIQESIGTDLPFEF